MFSAGGSRDEGASREPLYLDEGKPGAQRKFVLLSKRGGVLGL